MSELTDMLPKHDVSLVLEHNAHKNYYETAELWLMEDEGQHDWQSDKAICRALDTDSVWTLTWYPHTPIGSYSIAAPSLEELLAFAREVESND